MARFLKTIVAVALIFTLPGVVFAAGFTVDGRILPGEQYYTWTVGCDQTYTDGTDIPVTIKVAQDASDNNSLYVALVLPTDRKDNSYGTTRVGWGSKHQNMADLVESDKAEILIKNGSDKVVEATIDFLDEDKGAFTSGLVKGEGKLMINDSDPGEANWGDYVVAKTSLDRNLNDITYAVPGADYTTNSPAVSDYTDDTNYPGSVEPDWIWDHIYEFKIEGSVFGGAKIFDSNGFIPDWTFQVVGLHTSPYKAGSSNGIVPKLPTTPLTPPGGTPPGSVVPLPSGVWAGMIVLAGLGFMRIRRRRLSAANH